jgi:hypothetical protein
MNETSFNEHTTPPGGWQMRLPELGNWTIQHPIANTLNQTVLEVVKARKANPAITAKFQLSTNPEAVKAEVIRFNRKRLGLNPDGTPPPFQESRSNSLSVAVGVAAENLKRAAQGTAVGLDWLGAGGIPVAQELAEKRAAICVACARHVPGDWYVTAPAELIAKAIEAWKSLTGKAFKFETAQGDNLKSCDVCKCVQRLKVFVPLEHILAKTKPAVMAEFPAACWIARRDE